MFRSIRYILNGMVRLNKVTTLEPYFSPIAVGSQREETFLLRHGNFGP